MKPYAITMILRTKARGNDAGIELTEALGAMLAPWDDGRLTMGIQRESDEDVESILIHWSNRLSVETKRLGIVLESARIEVAMVGT